MLAPAKVNPIDHTFDAVLALAAVVMTDRPNARADIIHDESEGSNYAGRCVFVNRRRHSRVNSLASCAIAPAGRAPAER
jgi:hypothetical protein